MSVTSVSNSSATNLLSLFLQQSAEESDVSETTSKAASNANVYGGRKSGAGSRVMSTLMSEGGREAFSKAIAALKAEGKTTITFSMIEEYRGKLETDFSAKVREDLKALGVDENAQFSLVADSSGTMRVVTDSADKTKIEKYFADNPKMVEQFQTIQALSNFKRGAESAGVRDLPTMAAIKKGLQADAVQAFFSVTEEAGGYSSQIANFSGSGDSTSYLLGLNTQA